MSNSVLTSCVGRYKQRVVPFVNRDSVSSVFDGCSIVLKGVIVPIREDVY